MSTLLVARLSARRHDMGTRSALGASRKRLLRQTACEHCLIGVVGVACGIVVSSGLIVLFPTLFLDRTLNVIDLDMRTLVASSLAGLAAVFLSGLIPAWIVTKHDPAYVLRSLSQAGVGSSRARLLTNGLLVAQIGCGSALLFGSIVLVRSFINIVNADRGLDTAGVVRVNIDGIDQAFKTIGAMTHGLATIEQQVALWPEVVGVALSREIPPLAGGAGGEARVEGLDGYRVSPGFFSVYRVRIVLGDLFGRTLTEDEVIIGERLANQLWPGANPVGSKLVWPGLTPRRVVGVAREINLPALDPALDRPEFYLPLGNASRTLYLSLRCDPTCPDDSGILERLRKVHPLLRPRIAAPGDEMYRRQLELPQAMAKVSGAFAIVALLTASGGLYSVLSYAVRRRQREFGIRQALGASRYQLRLLLLLEGARVSVMGVAIGMLVGWIIARMLSSLLYGLNSADPITFVALVVSISLTSLVAMWGPSRQASSVNPVTLLREG